MRNIVQLIPKRTVHDKFPKAPDITPTFRTAYLEIITVGVRDLKPYGFQVRVEAASEFRGLVATRLRLSRGVSSYIGAFLASSWQARVLEEKKKHFEL